MLLVEWGYGGHCYERDELEVLEADLDCLRQYVSENEITLEVTVETVLSMNHRKSRPVSNELWVCCGT